MQLTHAIRRDDGAFAQRAPLAILELHQRQLDAHENEVRLRRAHIVDGGRRGVRQAQRACSCGGGALNIRVCCKRAQFQLPWRCHEAISHSPSDKASRRAKPSRSSSTSAHAHSTTARLMCTYRVSRSAGSRTGAKSYDSCRPCSASAELSAAVEPYSRARATSSRGFGIFDLATCACD